MLPAAIIVCAAGQVPAPDTAAQEAMVPRMREAALEYGDRRQNFTCTQVTARSIAPSATGPRWKPLETQELDLNYVTAGVLGRKTSERLRSGEATPVEESHSANTSCSVLSVAVSVFAETAPSFFASRVLSTART